MLPDSTKGKKIFAAFVIGFFLVLIYLLNQVFSGRLILPQTFHFGRLAMRYYGVIIAAATLAGFYFARARSERFGINHKQCEDLIVWLVIGGFLGARLYHIFSSWDFYREHFFAMFQVWRGGLSIYGAVLGGAASLWLYKKIMGLPLSFYHLLDWLAPSLLIGQIIGRLGNLFNYEVFGYPTGLPWKMYVPPQFRPPEFSQSAFYHPYFLYEALGNLLILFFLLKVIKFKSQGSLFFSYLLLYNLLRFGLEFLRTDSVFVGNFRLNAIASLILAAGSFIWLVSRYYSSRYSSS